ncbi:hypothetical protein V476_21815 [Pseudomonas syringae KCTC 12500]|uniref:hypothetical protein n=1 Tax=Pseudomonas syringae TaxID=317 RepID=UPI00046A317D|nr:hypothetical protein [Pseudomonas syringae]KMY03618.1 hypothetical protein V476_21815 [Pseudomonas syringae KCTC 12500]POR85139.1 hypothetical protein BKM21_14045 [Pseudomonas syringae pv. syringae]
MNARPLIVSRAKPADFGQSEYRDQQMLDDQIPAVLDRSDEGYVLSRQTYVTEVKLETTDDN